LKQTHGGLTKMLKKTSFKNLSQQALLLEGQKPLILLHGFTEDHRIWQGVLPHLGNQFKLVLPDLPGSGASAFHPHMTIDEMAEVVVHWLDIAAIQEATVIGHSMGGYVALSMARQYPQRVTALCLCASHPYADNDEKRNQRNRTISLINEKGSSHFLTAFLPSLFAPQNLPSQTAAIEALRALNAEFLPGAHQMQLAAMRERSDHSTWLASWDKPFGLLLGADDPLIPVALQFEMATLAPQTYFRRIAGAGHMLSYENPSATAEGIVEFMNFAHT
jgi:pimeloyl-ACP methyl ester carboxylesterase